MTPPEGNVAPLVFLVPPAASRSSYWEKNPKHFRVFFFLPNCYIWWICFSSSLLLLSRPAAYSELLTELNQLCSGANSTNSVWLTAFSLQEPFPWTSVVSWGLYYPSRASLKHLSGLKQFPRGRDGSQKLLVQRVGLFFLTGLFSDKILSRKTSIFVFFITIVNSL